MREPRLYIVGPDEILKGVATDIYFLRTKRILEAKNLCDLRVRYELHTHGFPKGYEWAVFAGLEEALALLQGRRVDVYALPEGTLFRSEQPLMVLEGPICEIVTLETALLGLLRFATSVATKAARIKKLARDKQVLFFGLRAHHPALQVSLDRAAYIGGADAISGALSEEYLGLVPKGTMPHALIIAFGSPVDAWKAYDEVMPPDVPRIALCDTFYDERYESLLAAQSLGKKLVAVRLDTPRSRRGSMRKIVEEVRWTLDLHGYRNVKIVVSGGIGERAVAELRDVADYFGVGTSIAFPPSVDISMDIVEVFRDGRWVPVSKRGKLPGMKQLYRCKPIYEDYVVPWGTEAPRCRDDSEPRPMLTKFIENGRLIRELPSLEEIRRYVLSQLSEMPEPEPLD